MRGGLILWRIALAVGVCTLLATGTAFADVAGRVVDDATEAPLVDAVISVRARPDIPPTRTLADGSFVLPLSESGIFELAAAVEYSSTASANYLTDTQQVFDGLTDVELRLSQLSTVEKASSPPPAAGQLCIACHSEYVQEWRTARHSGAADNFWVRDLYSGDGSAGGSAGYVFRDTHADDNSGLCATCHAPLEDVFTPGELDFDDVVTPAGRDGVTCLACHQISEVNGNVDALHHLGNATYRFPEADAQTSFHVFGNLPDVDRIPMQNVYQPQFGQSILCASCHEYKNPTTGAPGQATYSEWLTSPFAQPGPNFRSCQDCHMPSRGDTGSIGSGGPERPAAQRHSHAFVGATPETLTANIDLRVALQRDAQGVRVRAEVENRTGHAFPTGISIRNAVLVVEASIGGVPLTQISGPTVPFWGSDDVPGVQAGDLAGRPGKGFAKLLQGRINGQGAQVSPVLFIDAESAVDTLIPSAAVDLSQYLFAVPTGTPESAEVQVETRLLYRRAWRALAVTKGWTETPGGMAVEIPVQQVSQNQTLGSLGPAPTVTPPVAIPLGGKLLPLWLLLTVIVGLWLAHRRAPPISRGQPAQGAGSLKA